MAVRALRRVRESGALALVALTFPAWAAPAARPQTVLSVTVIGDPRDALAGGVEDAVAFWNGELERLGAGVRFGPPRFIDDQVTDRVLRELRRGKLDLENDDDLPELLEPIPGDVVVALSDADLMSFGVAWTPRGKGFVVLRRSDIEPLSLPNVARNAAAHELGHALGLGHNGDPATLMCGRPAPCRPAAFASATARFFPLTAADERRLLRRWGS